MPDFLTTALQPLPPSSFGVLVRLVIAMIAGGVVTLIYRLTRAADEVAPSFPVTLVLLSILIAMVTQVIGNNVARAFSLVGALAIVRFRTVVRDTEDTAFVIFAAVVGMAVGAQDLLVSIAGFVVASAVTFLIRPRIVTPTGDTTDAFIVHLRVGIGHNLEALAGPALDAHIAGRQLLSMKTARQGMAMDASFQGQLRSGASVEELVKTLNRLEGVQDVEIARPRRLEA